VTAGGSSTKTDYIVVSGTPGYPSAVLSAKVAAGGITAQVADAFGNTVSSGITNPTCTLVSFGGTWDSNNTAAATDTFAAQANCADSGAITSKQNYYQGLTYGSSAYVQVSMSGTYNAASFTATGRSQTLSTSAMDTTAPNTSLVCTGAIPNCTAVQSVSAGSATGVASTITLTFTLATAQAGVPVTFLSVNTTNPYTGSFVGGMGTAIHVGSIHDPANVTVMSTVTSGVATAVATFTVDTTTGDATQFQYQFAKPLTLTPTNFVGPSSPASAVVTTKAGTQSKLIVKAYFDKALTTSTTKSIAPQSLWIDIFLSDYWGNTAVNTAGQLSVNLAASPTSAGTFSANPVYIASGCGDTAGTACGGLFGSIQFALASSATGTVTITGSGFFSGSGSVTIVSPNPTITVNTPSGTIGHTVYSKFAGVGFSGAAAVSKGVFPVPTISSVSFTVDGGTAQTASGTTSWAAVATLANGLHTLTFQAKDSNGALSATNSTLVLVDTAAPTITVTSSASIQGGQPVTFSIVDTEGDLQASSVAATSNSTATLTTTVTGTNNPGSSVTYTVTVTGLPVSTGHWGVTLNAKDLAGNSATAVTAVVKVIVAFANSVGISGAAKATIGGYTGVSATVTNSWTTSQNLVMIAVWTNSAGQPVCVGFGSLTLASGGSASAFAGCLNTPASGTYTVNIFIITTANQGVSTKTTITVTL
jgi:hypothetical protein